jgi:hypothetical protein
MGWWLNIELSMVAHFVIDVGPTARVEIIAVPTTHPLALIGSHTTRAILTLSAVQVYKHGTDEC